MKKKILLRPFWEPKMIETNYASLTGKGVHKMYTDIERALNSALKRYPDGFVVMGDYSGYFASISIDREMEILYKAGIADNRVLNFIRMFSPDSRGLYLGNEASQFCKEIFRFNKQTQKYDRIMNPKRISMEAKKLCAIKDIDRMTEQYRSVRGTIASHPHTYHAIEKLDNLFISKGGKLQ